MKLLRFIGIIAFIYSMQANAGGGASCSKKSGQQTVALLELYTSEGCSSCPSADKLINNIYDATPLSAEQIIPIALHVDYWDYIGWKDTFANPLFSERQNYLAKLPNNSHGIYTPEFFLSGKEFRFSGTNLISLIKTINAQPARASIELTVSAKQNQTAELDISSTTPEPSQLFYGLTESNLISTINAGENKNRTLQHNYVARTWGTPITLAAGTHMSHAKLDIPTDMVADNLSFIAFIQTNKGEILQALSLSHCGF